MQLENHVLYYMTTCPYCQEVLRFMDEHDITMETRDIHVGNNRADLVNIGGKAQVPCLVINGKPMYESDDIVAYLKQKLGA